MNPQLYTPPILHLRLYASMPLYSLHYLRDFILSPAVNYQLIFKPSAWGPVWEPTVIARKVSSPTPN